MKLKMREIKNIEEIIRMYTEEGKSTHDIARLLDTHPGTIKRLLVKNNIQLRTTAIYHAWHKGPKSRKWTGFGEISGSCWARIKQAARIRGIDFTITIEQAWHKFLLQDRKCRYTDLDLRFPQCDYDMLSCNWTASLDRIDSLKGYTVDNIQWVHKDVNRMKWNLNERYFLELCKIISNKESSYE